jgi:hypothetical protein
VIRKSDAEPEGLSPEEEDRSVQGDAKDMPIAAYIEAYKEADENRPPGMPGLEEVFAMAKKIHLSSTEALQLFDAWLANGFTTKTGPIKDWRAAMRNWSRYVRYNSPFC